MGKRPAIAVNTRFLIKDKLEGIGLFTYESLKRIVQQHPEIDFYFLFDRPFNTEFIFADNVKPVVLFPQARHPLLWYWWFEISVAGWLKRVQPNLFLSPDCFSCLNTQVPQVLVLHDLAYEHFDDQFPWLTKRYFKYFIPRFTHHVNRIATVSEFTKADIISLYSVDETKIDVVYNGAKEVYRPLSVSGQQDVKNRLTGGKNYFVYVGSIHPRKNIVRLLLAFEKFKTATDSDFCLLLVGRKAWDFKAVEEVYAQMKHRGDVKFLGHIPPQELGQIVGASFAMVYVSLFEGFGIPIVEAMNCGVPVITSNISSMPEVAGQAALLVNPYSIDEIATAMQQLQSQPELRNALIQAGNLQVQKFSWELTADKLWKCCERVLNNI